MEKDKTAEHVAWPADRIIDEIRNRRNELIKDFLDERNIIEFFAQEYNRREINRVKIELLKKELKEMLIRPVDVKHYDTLIKELSEHGDAEVLGKNVELFQREVHAVLKYYVA